jgi:hypothetical protein
MIKLRDWQKVVLDEIDKHDEIVDSELYSSMSDLEINNRTSIKVKFPKGAGHTFLTAYLASQKYNTLFIYSDTDHLKEIQHYKEDIRSSRSKEEMSSAIKEVVNDGLSLYEIYYAVNHANMVNPTEKPIVTLASVKAKISGKDIIVIDKTSSLPTIVESFIFNVATGTIVLLG